MSARELLDRIIEARILDEKTIDRLRRQITEPGRDVKPRSIVRFLVEKGFIDERQAEDLLAGRAIVPRLVDDEQFEEIPAAADYDSGDLTNVASLRPAPAPETPLPPPVEQEERPAPAEKKKKRREHQDTRQIRPGEVPAEHARRPASPPAVASEPAWGAELAPQREHSFVRGKLGFAGKHDTTDQWKTRWLWTGFGVLAALLISLAVLWLGVVRVDADKLYAEAEENFRKENYGKAGELFQKFHEGFPGQDNASKARVREVNSYMRMHYKSDDFKNAYVYAIENLPRLEEEEAVEDIREELGVMIPVITEWYSAQPLLEKTTEGVKAKLAEARQVKEKLLDNPVYITTTLRNSARVSTLIGTIDNNLLTAEGRIRKEEDYQAAMTDIASLTTAGRTDEAFSTFTRLVRTHPDLGARAELREAMARVSARELELVQPVTTTITVAAGGPPTPVTRQILTGSTLGQPIEGLVGEVLAVLAEGSAFGLDAGTGKLLWRQFVGLPTTIQPQWTSEETRDALIVCDQQRHLVMRIAASTGEVAWTATVGEPFFAPRITAEAVFVTTASGQILRLDPATGRQTAGAKLPRRISAGCDVADQSPELYLTGDDSNLYLLSSDDLRCSAVYYLGHAPGSVSLAPIYWSGYLLVVVNGSDYSELHVLQRSEEDGSLRRIQLMRLANGPVSVEPSRLGRLMLFTSDNGDIRILDMNPAEPENPVRISHEGTFAVRGGVRPWSFASGSDLWIAGMGITPLRIQRATGELDRITVKNQADVFLGPIRRRDEYLFHIRRRGNSQMVSVAAVNPADLTEVWRTDFGASPAGSPQAAGDGLNLITSQGNLLRVGPEELDRGAATEVARSSEIDEALNFQSQLQFDDGSRAAFGPAGYPYMLAIDPSGVTRLVRLQPPADQAACPPLSVGDNLIIASTKGQLMRIDRSTGQYSGSPFLPPMSPGQVLNWNRPAQVGPTSFLIGDGVNQLLLMDLSDPLSVRKLAEKQLDGEIRSGITSIGEHGWLVEQGETGSRLIRVSTAGGTIEPAGAVDLPGPTTQEPFAVGELILVATEDGQLHAVNEAAAMVWSLPTGGDRIAAVVATGSNGVAVCFEKGLVQLVSAAGEVTGSLDLGQPISHQPLVEGNRWLFTAADGTLLVVDQSGP
jgi:outer membrane protein assembly factor BamB/TolA-binding protein